MYKVRDALDLLDQRALVDLAAARDVRGARSNDERRQVLARSYRGNAAAFLADLPRSELLFLAREWGLGVRGAGIASKSRDELSALLLPCFGENGAGPRSGNAQTQAAPPLAAELDGLLPGWLVRLDTPVGSRDPLGLQAISGKHADRLLPGLTVFTSRARYYGFLCWAVATAEQEPSPELHLERVQRLERLLVLGEALLHGDDARACAYVGARRGRAFVREASGASLMSLPTRILKNQTSNGALRLYRTSLVDVGLAEEDDVDVGLGLELTERGRKLAESYGDGLDPSTVAWALSGSDQRKRRDTLEDIADAMCLSSQTDRRERTLVFDALFGRKVETATQNALRRRTTAYCLMREGIVAPREEQPDVLAEDADAVAEDGGVAAAQEESSGNWRVVRALLELPPKADIADLQVAAAYQVLALALNQIFRSCLEAVSTAGRISVDKYLSLVAERGGPGFDAPAGEGSAPTTRDVVKSADACMGGMDFPQMATTGLDLLVGALRCEATLRWLGEIAPEDAFVGNVLERARTLGATRRELLRGLIPELVLRHRNESSRKGKGDWLALEDDQIVRKDPRPLLPIIHALRFAQLEQLVSDLGVRVEEVTDVA